MYVPMCAIITTQCNFAQIAKYLRTKQMTITVYNVSNYGLPDWAQSTEL